MSKTIYYSLIFGYLLIPSGFRAPFWFAPISAEAAITDNNSVITNEISVTATSDGQKTNGQDGLNGANGADGQDGNQGLDGTDGSTNYTSNKAEASVKITTVVGGKEVPQSTIDIETTSPSSASIQKFQEITTSQDETTVKNVVRVADPKETGKVQTTDPDNKTNDGTANVNNDSETAKGTPSTAAPAPIVEDQPTSLLSAIINLVFNSLKNLINAILSIF